MATWWMISTGNLLVIHPLLNSVLSWFTVLLVPSTFSLAPSPSHISPPNSPSWVRGTWGFHFKKINANIPFLTQQCRWSSQIRRYTYCPHLRRCKPYRWMLFQPNHFSSSRLCYGIDNLNRIRQFGIRSRGWGVFLGGFNRCIFVIVWVARVINDGTGF